MTTDPTPVGTVPNHGTRTGQLASKASDDVAGPYQLFALSLSVLALASMAGTTLLPFSQDTRAILDYADNTVCLLFFADFGYSFWRAADRWGYLRTWGWIDLLSSIPTIDALRWGRALRVLRVLRVLRAAKSARTIAVFILQRRTQSTVLAAVLLTLLLLVFASVSILQVEIPASGNIANAQDAMWWAFSTMATVGYGDRFPVTPEGRGIAVMLMVAGVGLFGTLSGLIASWFLSSNARQTSHELDEIRHMIGDIHSRTVERHQQSSHTG